MTDNTHILPSGTRLSDYELKGVLGRPGGFGVTYLAQDVHLGLQVAIKEYLPADFARRADGQTVQPKTHHDQDDFNWGLKRFLEEGRTLARLKHVNIVGIQRYFEANGTGYIVMEYVEGETLSAFCEQVGQLSGDELLGIMLPLLDGLEQVHASDYLHRDIKPANILLRPDGSPVLIDFGAARQAVGGRSRGLTSVVTPGYAPFEQYSTKGTNQGPWTDIYALAAVAYKCLTGVTPTESTDRVAEDDLEPAVRAGRGRAAESLLQAIDHGLSVMHTDRPQSVAAWRAELTQGRTTTAPPGPEPNQKSAPGPQAEDKTIRTPRLWPPLLALRAVLLAWLGQAGLRFALWVMRSVLLSLFIIFSLLWLLPTLAELGLGGTDADPPAVVMPAAEPGSEPEQQEPFETPATERETDEVDATAELEARFADQLSSNRLILPQGDNASDTLKSLEAESPGHPLVTSGRAQIAERYLQLARDDIATSSWKSAEDHVANAQDFGASDSQLAEVRSRILSGRQQAQKELAEQKASKALAEKVKLLASEIRSAISVKDFNGARRAYASLKDISPETTLLVILDNEIQREEQAEKERCSQRNQRWVSKQKVDKGNGYGNSIHTSKYLAVSQAKKEDPADTNFCRDSFLGSNVRNIQQTTDVVEDCDLGPWCTNYYGYVDCYDCSVEYDYTCTFEQLVEESPPGC